MVLNSKILNQNNDIGLLILRVSIGAMMLLHGIAKLKGLTGIETLLDKAGLPTILAPGVYITEIIAPILIMIGYRTRLASVVFGLGAMMAMCLAHSGDILSLNQHGGWGVELLGLYLFGSITLFFTGAGKFAVSSSSNWD